MDKLKKKILLISLMLILLMSLQGAAAAGDDGNLTSENFDLSICDNEGYAGSDSVLTAASSEALLGEDYGNFTELQELINSHYNGNLTLNKSYKCNGESEITIKGPITIYGNGHTLDGNHEARIFYAYVTKVVVRDIIFVNGHADYGGAMDGGTAINCTFTNNTADASGGAVISTNAKNCTFTNNHADSNGGAMDGDTATNCTFTNNTADADGGAMYFANAINCTFTKNTAYSFGGAMNGGTATNCTFTNNTADADGGAMVYGNAVNSIFKDNHLPDGKYNDIYRIILSENCIFMSTTTHQGDDIVYPEDTIVFETGKAIPEDIERPVIVFNQENEIVNNATVTINGKQITVSGLSKPGNYEICYYDKTNNKDKDYNRLKVGVLKANSTVCAEDVAALYGNTISIPVTSVNATNVTYRITNNKGDEVANGTIGPNDTISLSGLAIGKYTVNLTTVVDDHHNSATNASKLIITDGTTFWDLNRTINGNADEDIYLDGNYTYNPDVDSDFKDGIIIDRKVNIHGNGHTLDAKSKTRIFNVKASDVEVHDTIFVNGKAEYDNGGAMHGGNAINCTFTNNHAETDGGAIIYGNAINCTFTNNDAIHGGAMYCGAATNCTFTNNFATRGGAMADGTATNCTFTYNNGLNGGAIFDGTATNCTFNNNYALDEGGGAIYNGTATNCTFTNNHADIGCGGAIYNGNAKNCIFTDNTAYENGGAMYYGEAVNSIFKDNLEHGQCNDLNGTSSNNCIFISTNTTQDVNITYSEDVVFETKQPIPQDIERPVIIFNQKNEIINDATVKINGTTVTVSGLNTPDNYEICYYNETINSDGDKNYNRVKVALLKANVTIDPVATGDLVVDAIVNVTFTLPTDIDGNVSVTIDNKAVVGFAIDNGTVTIPGIYDMGNHTAIVNLTGDTHYNDATGSTTFNIEKGTTTITITGYTSPINIGDDTFVAFRINRDVMDNAVTLWIDGSEIFVYDFEFNEDSFLITQDKFPKEGNYNISVQYRGNSRYNASNIASCIITVEKNNVTMNVEGSTVYYGENATITVTGLPDDASGNVSVRVGDGIFFAYIKNGTAVIEIPDLLVDKYERLTVIYFGDGKYNNASGEATIIVKPASSKIVIDPIADATYGEDVVVTYSVENETSLNITVTASNGSAITSGIDSSVKGRVVISGLDAGKYAIDISNAEKGNYLGCDAEAEFNVLKAGSAIGAENKTFVYPEDVILVANGENSTGINESSVVVRNLNGIVKAIVKVNGFKMTITGLGAGNYTVYYNNTVGNNWNSAGNATGIVILKANSSVNASDVNVTYGNPITVVVKAENATEISYQITDNNNNVVASGTIKPNETINISDLAAGEYTVNLKTIVSSNYTVANNTSKIIVKPAKSSVNASDVNITYGETISIPVSVTNASEFYYAIVDENGITVDSDILQAGSDITVENLSAGNYNVTLITGVDENHTSVTNNSKITVKPAQSSVSAEDVTVNYGEAISIEVTSINATGISYQITDNNNNVIASGTIKPNETINISDLAAGEYTVNLATVTDENHINASNTSRLHVKHVVSIVIGSISGYAGEVINFTAEFKYENGDPVNEGIASLAIKYNDRQVLSVSLYSVLGAVDSYSTDVSDGKAVFNVKLGDPGIYPYVVTYSSADVDEVQEESTLIIEKLNTSVSCEDVSGKAAEEMNIAVDVLDQNNNPANNGTVTLTLNGEDYNATVDNGKATINVKLPNPGSYNATIRYDGNDYYGSSESSISVDVEKVNTNVPSAEDVSGKAGEKIDISIKLDDENGNPVKNGTAALTVDGKTYTADVVNGTATFKDVVLPENDTVADVYYQGNAYYNSSSTTFSIKITQDNNNTEPDNNTDEINSEHVSSKAVDAVKATGNPIAILVMVFCTLVITYRKK